MKNIKDSTISNDAKNAKIGNILEHLIYVFEEIEPHADRNRILEYFKKILEKDIKSESPKDKVKRLLKEAEEIIDEKDWRALGEFIIEIARMLQIEENKKP